MRVASVLARILASTVIAACGGAVADVSESGGPSSTGSSGSSGGTPSSSGSSRPPNPPVLRDASAPDGHTADAGCTSGPVLVSNRGENCADVWQSPCGVPKDVIVEDGLTQEECAKVCGSKTSNGGPYWGCAPHLTDELPGPSFDCFTCVEGRRPEGYVDPPVDGTIAGWLAHAADLERVSVDAFQILGRELTHHGAPASLVRAAAAAEADEVRHTRALAALAVREGATLSSSPVTQGAPRALVDIALENAVEGCIRETYGALVAGWQAEHAQRSDMRRVMRRIYVDETVHAELAWDVHAWLRERLTPAERARVDQAMRAAVAELVRAACAAVGTDLVAELGLPPAGEARRLVEGLRDQLFSAVLAA